MSLHTWGKHSALDCQACDIESIKSAENIEAFTKALVKRIDMVAFGEPQIVHFGSGNKTGYTLVQLIETSNICAHFCDDTGDVYLDVFSCKEFNVRDVIDVFNEYFKPKKILWLDFLRDSENPIRQMTRGEEVYKV